MSLFRKPKKIHQRRMFTADDDEDGDPEPPPPPVISHKKENKPIKPTNTPLLSFADEEEEGEEFKVKKSSQSKRLAKRREKEREKRRPPDGDSNKYDNNGDEDKPNDIDQSDKPKPKKKVTLEGLILSGREALAADGAGDLSEDSANEEEEDSRGFHQYRADSVRAALAVAPGLIPDAALIHAARKTRQQARELGDFVPIQNEPSTGGSRLIREDGSGDEEEEGRLIVRGLELPSDKPKRGTAAAASEEELDSEAEEWVEQQMQKAMPAIADITGELAADLNPFAAPPPPARAQPLAQHLRPLQADMRNPTTVSELIRALRERLEEQQTQRDKTWQRRSQTRDALQRAARERSARAARTRALDAAYRRAQAARGYLTDLVECLDEKMPQLEALEARALAMHRRRCEFIMERRRADVRDQAQDVLTLAARPGAAKPIDSEEKIRRCAEREGRRRARRLRRDAAAAAAGAAARHRDGDSSDDELPPAELQHYTQERETIRQLSRAVFADALAAWRGARGVCARVSRWRRREPALYADVSVASCLPALLAPYVRHQLILWNPLADEDNEDYERMDWYKCVMMYGVRHERLSDSDESDSETEGEAPAVSEDSVREDPDLMLAPTLVAKVVLPKLTELVEQAWDPMCVRACVRLRQLIVRCAALPATSPAVARLAVAAHARLAAALAADVFLPAVPPHIMEGAGGPFWRRSLGAGARLLRAALALCAPPSLLRADGIVLALIETLSCAAGAAPGPQAAEAAAALAASLPRSGALRAVALRRLAALATLALSRLQTDNPMHLKALEQARAVIAEAKAME
ncbi:PAX3- and PAX7-binding protein 1 [Plodia interpunctella]|uniref:PAX3- and PAX7-binding protein 1 n=1 Tax=Plodia interpunctella TaxID=58824 RepID=UPI002368C351|nr:PAX3- and PAX7-binding protein 1 [Plodia interpunctella]